MLAVRDSGQVPHGPTAALIETCLRRTDARLRDLTHTRDTLRDLLP
nr:hypothetical protein [Streptomyces sp. RFCAC02]